MTFTITIIITITITNQETIVHQQLKWTSQVSQLKMEMTGGVSSCPVSAVDCSTE